MKDQMHDDWIDYANKLGISTDKRTKEYRQFKLDYSQESEGLGDTVKKITDATGISKVVEFFNNGEPCSACERRRKKWNKLFRYTKPKELTEGEYSYLNEFFKKEKSSVSSDEQYALLAIHNRVLSSKKRFSRCVPCVRGMVEDLRKIYIEY